MFFNKFNQLYVYQVFTVFEHSSVFKFLPLWLFSIQHAVILYQYALTYQYICNFVPLVH